MEKRKMDLTQLNSKYTADAGVNTSISVSKYRQIVNDTISHLLVSYYVN